MNSYFAALAKFTMSDSWIPAIIIYVTILVDLWVSTHQVSACF